jgi:DNA-binding transcriptional ArsR family regulator
VKRKRLSRVSPTAARLTIVNQFVNYYAVQQDVDVMAGTAIEALGDPVRRQVVTLLSAGPRRAGELAAATGLSAPAMSRHLRVLLAARVIEDERLADDARARAFRLRPASIQAVRSWLDQVTGTNGPF